MNSREHLDVIDLVCFIINLSKMLTSNSYMIKSKPMYLNNCKCDNINKEAPYIWSFSIFLSYSESLNIILEGHI